MGRNSGLIREKFGKMGCRVGVVRISYHLVVNRVITFSLKKLTTWRTAVGVHKLLHRNRFDAARGK